MLHETGIYVLESKNYSGWIFGSESDQYWTQTFSTGRHHSHKEYFFNPIIQNNVHIKWLKTFLNDSSLNFYSYIVFGDNCTFKSIKAADNSCTVLNNKNLLFNIKYKINTSEKTLTPDKIDSLYNILYPFTQLTEEEKTRHIQKIKEKYSVYNESSTPKVFPRCGNSLILRTVSHGARAGKQILGCSSYPRCKYFLNIETQNNETSPQISSAEF